MDIKKRRFVLSLILIFIFISSKGFTSTNKIHIIMDGKNHKVTEVPVIIDGQAIHSDIPTFIHKDYTFVSIRFIAEYYGAEVNWDQRTKTATVIQKDKEIKMTINSEDVYINNEKRILDEQMIPKFVTFSNNDSRTMVPLRFISEAFGYEVGWNSEIRTPFINIPNSNMDTVEITNIEIEKEYNNEPRVIVYGTKKLNYSTMLLENPSRLVIDIDDAILKVKDDIIFDGGVGNIYVDGHIINKIAFSQFSNKPDIVRIVVHLWDEFEFDIETMDEDKSLRLSFEGQETNNTEWGAAGEINYSLDIPDRIITIDAKEKTDYNVAYDERENTMTITIPSENISLKENFINIKDGLINDIITDFIDEQAKIILSFRRDVEYTILSNSKDDKISISLKGNENIKPEDRLVVIDPGHGGKDPGAVSPNGTKEKDVVLAISHKLNEGLEAKGYNTLMIRNEDFFVDKRERANIANMNQGDIFISIHANAFEENPKVSGIEILYCPTNSNKVDRRNNYQLAKIISQEMGKALNAENRGLVKAPNTVVVRDTKMPAILIETGFLTNPEEEELIKDEDYQNKMVESIIIGIEKYFEIY